MSACSKPLGSTLGLISSIDSCGASDGPGIRLVVFLQGCTFRCAYCHNPETWEIGGGKEISAQEILEQYRANKAFYAEGGITISGGEPLLQPEFVGSLFALAHQENPPIHTTLDTAGGCFDLRQLGRYELLLDNTDLVLLDLKHTEPNAHKKLTGSSLDATLSFANELARRDIKTIIRHVIVEGLTDTEEELAELGNMIARWDNVIGVELLPYHSLAKQKYENLGIDYPLKKLKDYDASKIPELTKIVLDARAETRT